jgi:hypothetical protein
MPDEWQGHPQRKDYPLEGPGELLLENPVDWLKVRQQTRGRLRVNRGPADRRCREPPMNTPETRCSTPTNS